MCARGVRTLFQFPDYVVTSITVSDEVTQVRLERGTGSSCVYRFLPAASCGVQNPDYPFLNLRQEALAAGLRT